ncbi:hypothetical protein BO70DRAFT_147391 [Aspergillus heteromorphus CBS 117.55]|uniref:Uncharacterized protein n=1 Tax=Aspergillus heteromorphus CBS 117.55 TaxID=1448321 RepID=A0A317V945_9EURO|nr:uncharacterized protein BO70DRAFT_147391 [Aspergillus heteromorphus CBS 117.55]PWY69517.1 hypothetical protein BO70DRAFT_147391 [Aspergillus heteromorphus CBS 117.55]
MEASSLVWSGPRIYTFEVWGPSRSCCNLTGRATSDRHPRSFFREMSIHLYLLISLTVDGWGAYDPYRRKPPRCSIELWWC